MKTKPIDSFVLSTRCALVALALSSTAMAAVDPVADTGGPYYRILSTDSLALDGSLSLPSDTGTAITLYEWDLNNDGIYDVTGATPAAIDHATLTGAFPGPGWGMKPGLNTIQLRVTDDSSPTPLVSTATTTVVIDAATFTGPNGAFNNDRWNVAANWDGGTGTVPSGTINVVIPASKYASVSQNYSSVTCPLYTGDLFLESNATLEVANASNVNDLRAMGTGNITFKSGSQLILRYSTTSSHSQNFVMEGNGTFAIGTSTSAHNDDRTLTGAISGSGQLSVRSTNGQRLTLQNDNTGWTGGLIMGGTLSENKNESLRANAAGALGGGDVTINDGVGLVISVADAIADTARLSLSGGDGEQTFKLEMAAADTIDKLNVDGFSQPAGTYGKVGSGADFEKSWITGNSLLTVTSTDLDETAPTATFTATGAGGGTTNVYETEPVTYIVTFSEPHSPQLTAGDLENSTATAVTIGSVTPLFLTGNMTNLSYRVVVTPTEPGTINLQIKSGTVINDLAGNTLAVPAADNDTLTVDALPAIQGQLGVWKPWANNRINPATGQPWAVGDTYRLAFKTSTTRDATSTDIADYNAFVQGVAAASTGYPDLEDGTWKVLASTATVSASANTGTASGTGVSVILMDGSTIFATSNADLWNGTAARPDVAGVFLAPYFNENGVDDGLDDSIFTGTALNGSTFASQPLGGNPTNVQTGKARPNNSSRWMAQFNFSKTSTLKFFALSDPLTLEAVGGPGDVDHFEISAIDSPQTVGTAITGITITAKDGTDAVATSFTGTVTFGGTGGFSGTSAAFTAGVLTGVSVTPTVAGTNLTLTVDDGASHTGSTTIATIQTQYAAWAGGAAFDADANGDGVNNGLAWLLGAADPSANAIGLLPTVDENNGDLVMTFTCLKIAERGAAVLNLQHSSDLGDADPWESVAVPDSAMTVGDVVFTVPSVNPNSKLVNLQATIPVSKASANKLFGRLHGLLPP